MMQKLHDKEKFVSIGFKNVVNTDRILAILDPNTSANRRLIQDARDKHMLLEATNSKKSKSIIAMDSGHLVLSALNIETISNRINQINDKADNE